MRSDKHLLSGTSSVALLVAAIVLASLPPQTAVAKSRGAVVASSCAPTRSSVIHADQQGEIYRRFVYRKLEGPGPSRLVPVRADDYACSFSGGKSRLLGLHPECEAGGGGDGYKCNGVTLDAIAGDYVAFIRFNVIESPPGGDVSQHSWRVVVLNLKSGQVVYSAPAGIPERHVKGFVGSGAVSALVLDDKGGVAWIAQDVTATTNPVAEPPVYEVLARNAGGPLRMLSHMSYIAPRSLALAPDGTLSWRHNEEVVGATLK